MCSDWNWLTWGIQWPKETEIAHQTVLRWNQLLSPLDINFIMRPLQFPPTKQAESSSPPWLNVTLLAALVCGIVSDLLQVEAWKSTRVIGFAILAPLATSWTHARAGPLTVVGHMKQSLPSHPARPPSVSWQPDLGSKHGNQFPPDHFRRRRSKCFLYPSGQW